jgi:glutathione S-transferase
MTAPRQPARPIKLYGTPVSGHVHRVRLFLTLLDLPFEAIDIDMRAHALFEVMEQHLAAQPFLAGESVTLADIANYAYVAHAPEGGVPLDAYANVRRWLARVEALPGFVPMVRSPVARAA